MVTIAVNKGGADKYGQGAFYDIRGLSTDEKPNNVPNGSSYAEIDTGKGYLFDAEESEWHEIPTGSAVVIPVATGVSF